MPRAREPELVLERRVFLGRAADGPRNAGIIYRRGSFARAPTALISCTRDFFPPRVRSHCVRSCGCAGAEQEGGGLCALEKVAVLVRAVF